MQRFLKISFIVAFFVFTACNKPPRQDDEAKILPQNAAQAADYKTVTIGAKTWMAANIAATVDKDGNKITCYANIKEDPDFIKKYGCLYTWHDALKVCPKGWHLPEEGDFESLLNAAGSSPLECSQKLRAQNWSNGADKYGFAALPVGYYSGDSYKNLGDYAHLWSSTPANSSYAYTLNLGYHLADLGESAKHLAHSVRCLKD